MMRRSFSRDFKLEVCQLVESGGSTKTRVCREHSLSPSMLDRWVEQYRALGDKAFSGSEWRVHAKDPEARVRELDAALREALGKLGPRSGRKSP
jgi:transposase-like protein